MSQPLDREHHDLPPLDAEGFCAACGFQPPCECEPDCEDCGLPLAECRCGTDPGGSSELGDDGEPDPDIDHGPHLDYAHDAFWTGDQS